MPLNEQIVQALFETRALRISPADQPFFYTSGTIGPYYINTHFLFGSEAEANELLGLIEAAVQQPEAMTSLLWPRIDRQYRENATFKRVIDALAAEAEKLTFDCISGGERRDFFFSLPLSRLAGKPAVNILKSGEAWLFDTTANSDRFLEPGQLSGQIALHVSDLVTEASSYIRTWIPTIHRLGAAMPDTLTVVDRDQGGAQALARAGTGLHALTVFSADLFDGAREAGLVTADQHRQILQFLHDPAAFQSTFLAEHPDFLAEQIRQGGKNGERARLLLERFHVK